MLYSSSITWASSTRSSESMSRSSKRESGFTFSGSSPNSTSAPITLSVTWSLVAVVTASPFSLGGHAAVHGHNGPGHIGSLFRGQEADTGGDALRRPGSPGRNRIEQPAGSVGVGAVAGEVLGQLGLDQARGDGVHRHAAPGDL